MFQTNASRDRGSETYQLLFYKELTSQTYPYIFSFYLALNCYYYLIRSANFQTAQPKVINEVVFSSNLLKLLSQEPQRNEQFRLPCSPFGSYVHLFMINYCENSKRNLHRWQWQQCFIEAKLLSICVMMLNPASSVKCISSSRPTTTAHPSTYSLHYSRPSLTSGEGGLYQYP